MTFKFDPTLQDDVSLVRFHIGDTKPQGHYLEDETIKRFVDLTDWKHAVITCIMYIITQLSQPDFVKDWLEVSNAKAREGYENLLKEKRVELRIGTFTATSTMSLPTRADSFQINNDYSELPELDDDIPFNIEEGTP